MAKTATVKGRSCARPAWDASCNAFQPAGKTWGLTASSRHPGKGQLQNESSIWLAAVGGGDTSNIIRGGRGRGTCWKDPTGTELAGSAQDSTSGLVLLLCLTRAQYTKQSVILQTQLQKSHAEAAQAQAAEASAGSTGVQCGSKMHCKMSPPSPTSAQHLQSLLESGFLPSAACA